MEKICPKVPKRFLIILFSFFTLVFLFGLPKPAQAATGDSYVWVSGQDTWWRTRVAGAAPYPVDMWEGATAAFYPTVAVLDSSGNLYNGFSGSTKKFSVDPPAAFVTPARGLVGSGANWYVLDANSQVWKITFPTPAPCPPSCTPTYPNGNWSPYSDLSAVAPYLVDIKETDGSRVMDIWGNIYDVVSKTKVIAAPAGITPPARAFAKSALASEPSDYYLLTADGDVWHYSAAARTWSKDVSRRASNLVGLVDPNTTRISQAPWIAFDVNGKFYDRTDESPGSCAPARVCDGLPPPLDQPIIAATGSYGCSGPQPLCFNVFWALAGPPVSFLRVRVFNDDGNGVFDPGEEFTTDSPFGPWVASTTLDGWPIFPDGDGNYYTFITASPATHFLGIMPNGASGWSKDGCHFSDDSPCSYSSVGSYYNTPAFSVGTGNTLVVDLGIKRPGCKISISSIPRPLPVPLGGSADFTVTVGSAGGFAGTVETRVWTAFSWGYYNLKGDPITFVTVPPSATITLRVKTTGLTLLGGTYGVVVWGQPNGGAACFANSEGLVVIWPWLKTTGGDVGSLGAIDPIKRALDTDNFPDEFNADYLVISQGLINPNFKSKKSWRVGGYVPLNIYPERNTTNPTMYDVLWDKFGKDAWHWGYNDLEFDKHSPDGKGSGIYYHGDSTNFTLNSCINSTTFNGWSVLFIDGDLILNENIGRKNGGSVCNYSSPTNQGARIVFVVSGNVVVDSAVKNLHGYFIANGTFDDGTSGTNLVINGGLSAFGKISFSRTYIATADPAEQIDFDPGYLWYFRDLIGDQKVVYHEVAP